MKEFIHKYEDRIHGVLSCFDRMLFRGYQPIMSGWSLRPTGRHTRRRAGLQTQVREDLLDHRLLQNRGDDLQFAAAVRAVGRRQLSWPLDDNYLGRWEAGIF